MKREKTGKRLRFEVFKRDHFTCQYCGAQPPDVVLVCDHFEPVAAGGTTTIENLITACEACNQGKTDRPVETPCIRPDADLLYLAKQQELAELRRYKAVLEEYERGLTELIEPLQEVWTQHSGTDWVPADHIVRTLLHRYPIEVATDALIDVAGKCGTGYVRDEEGAWVPYLFGVARNMAKAQEGE